MIRIDDAPSSSANQSIQMMGSDPNLNSMKLSKYRQIVKEKKSKKRRKNQQLSGNTSSEARHGQNIVIKVIDVQAPIFLKADISSFRLLVQEFTGNNSNESTAYSNSPSSYTQGAGSPSSPSSSSAHDHDIADLHAHATATSTIFTAFEDYISHLAGTSSSCDSDLSFDFDIEPNWNDLNRNHLIANLQLELEQNENRGAILEAAFKTDHENPSMIPAYNSTTESIASIHEQCSTINYNYNLWDYN